MHRKIRLGRQKRAPEKAKAKNEEKGLKTHETPTLDKRILTLPQVVKDEAASQDKFYRIIPMDSTIERLPLPFRPLSKQD